MAGGSKDEGRAALIARHALDKGIFRMTQEDLASGDIAGLASLQRAIIIETYTELLDILSDYSRRFGRGGKAAKQGMLAILSDSDVFGQFDADQQARDSGNSCRDFSLCEKAAPSTSCVNPNRSGKVYLVSSTARRRLSGETGRAADRGEYCEAAGAVAQGVRTKNDKRPPCGGWTGF